jgi:hypothetical protein
MAGEPDPPPPILGTWRALYSLVLGTLAFVIALFALLSRLYG